MDSIIVIFTFAIINILECNAEISWQERLNLLMRYRRAMDKSKQPTIFNKNIDNLPLIFKDISENPNRRNLVSVEEPEIYGFRKSSYDQEHPKNIYKVNRRLYDFHAGMRSPIIGAPSSANHLPEAEPILPGHTLLRPALGMLKSAVKFPHKDLGDSSGVYGNIDNLGIAYSGTGERVLYSGFRRRYDNFNEGVNNDRPRVLVAILHKKRDYEKKPIARYVDYGKLEREKKRKRAEELRLQEEERLRISSADSVPYTDVKRLLKTLTANGVTLEFFEIPQLKADAMEKENYDEKVKPYPEFLEATRMKDLDTVDKKYPALFGNVPVVEQRFPAIAKPNERNFVPQKYRQKRGYWVESARGIKKYERR